MLLEIEATIQGYMMNKIIILYLQTWKKNSITALHETGSVEITHAANKGTESRYQELMQYTIWLIYNIANGAKEKKYRVDKWSKFKGKKGV